MKILHAYGALGISLGTASAASVIFIFFSLVDMVEGKIADAMFDGLFILILFLGAAFGGLRIYCTHWIMYGNDKIVIRRVCKEWENGRLVGKWKNREDTFMLEEIEAYGLSMPVLGRCVEHHRSSGGKLRMEVFFQLKNGKKIAFELLYYTKAIDEFFQYIHDKTGIEFQDGKKKKSKKRKLKKKAKGENHDSKENKEKYSESIGRK